MCLSGIENASDIALYSGLGAAVVVVAVLVIGITLYRRSQSDYGVDVIDSSALKVASRPSTSKQSVKVSGVGPPTARPQDRRLHSHRTLVLFGPV